MRLKKKIKSLWKRKKETDSTMKVEIRSQKAVTTVLVAIPMRIRTVPAVKDVRVL